MQSSEGLISMVLSSKKFFIAWRSFPQAENCPGQNILIPVSCQHLPVIKKWWSQLEWWTDACSREPREQCKMLVKHVSMSAFSWQQNFIHVSVLSQHCVADAVNSAVSGWPWSCLDSCRSWAGLIFDSCSASTVPMSLIWNYLTALLPQEAAAVPLGFLSLLF